MNLKQSFLGVLLVCLASCEPTGEKAIGETPVQGGPMPQWPNPLTKTRGEIWPMPQSVEDKGFEWAIDKQLFAITCSLQCDIITEAIKRYTDRIFTPPQTMATVRRDELTDQRMLSSLKIVVDGGCPVGVPQFGMDESYKLDVTTSDAVLKAAEVWGALRGLETFSHLVYRNGSQGYALRAVSVKDFPRFPHRGVLLDTSRHYLSLNTIKANLDLMAQNKFNVFHWHIVDSDSFPYASEVLPEFSKGAFTSKHVYTLAQIKDIIAYARLRGIRVIPEFDTPGHMKAWSSGYPSLLTRCFNKDGVETFDRNMIDPTQDDTWDVLLALFNEVFQLFPENYVHLGGDETEFWIPDCWSNNRNITGFMKIYGLNTTRDLEEWYFKKLLNLLERPSQTIHKKYILWQEVFDADIELEGSIAHVWRGATKAQQMAEMQNVTSKGHFAILSSCWYLNYIRLGPDWIDYYMCDPQDFNGSAAQRNLVLGGEAALWGEFVDESNVVPRLWPRASAAAERLWSPKEKTLNATEQWPRLYEMQCRMASRGYPVQPGYGPGFCEFEYQANLPI